MRHIIVTIMLGLMAVSAVAGPRTRQQALALAQQQAALQGRALSSSSPARAPRRATATSTDAPYYVFNFADQQGYTIVAGDDAMPDIVGYTTTGSFNADSIPEALQEFLTAYESTVAAVEEGNSQAVRLAAEARLRRANSVTTAVGPLVQTHWNQSTPFNLLCPKYDGTNLSATGCVATAMAQLIYYFHTDDQVLAADIPSYTTTTYKLAVDSVPVSAGQYDWDNMLLSYSSGYSDEEAAAVAKLMKHAGASVRMNYGPSSGASGYMAFLSFIRYYGMGYNTALVERPSYSYSEWIDLLDGELDNRRPVMYNGKTATGSGHAFICDGRDTQGYYHINWGWGGTSDGYFDITVLLPTAQGIGGSTGDSGYGFGNSMIVGMHAPSRVALNRGLTLSAYTSNKVTYYPTLTIDNDGALNDDDVFTGSVNCAYYNFNIDAWTGWVTLGMKSGSTYIPLKSEIKSISNLLYKSGYSDRTFTFSNSFPVGTTRLFMIQSTDNGQTWSPLCASDDYPLYVSNDGFTLTDTLMPLDATLEATFKKNVAANINFTLTNNTDAEYNDVYYLFVKNEPEWDETWHEEGSYLAANNACVPVGESKTFVYRYLPTTTDTRYIWLVDRDGYALIDGQPVTVEDNTDPILTLKRISISNAKPNKKTVTLSNKEISAYDVNDTQVVFNYTFHNGGGEASVLIQPAFGVDVSSFSYSSNDSRFNLYDFPENGDTTLSFTKEVSVGQTLNCRLLFQADSILTNACSSIKITKSDVTRYFYYINGTACYGYLSGLTMADVNNDDLCNITDLTAIADYLQGKAPSPFNLKAADMDGSGRVSLTDLTRAIQQLKE